MSFLEIAKRHLISGYSDIWDFIIKNQSKSEGFLNDLDEIIKEFKDIIISEIGDDFVPNDNPDLESNEIKNTYYEKLFSETYNEINIRINNDCRRLLCCTIIQIQDFTICFI